MVFLKKKMYNYKKNLPFIISINIKKSDLYTKYWNVLLSSNSKKMYFII